MEPAEYAPWLSAAAVVLLALLAGPVLGIPQAPADTDACSDDTPIGTGNATLSDVELPDRAVIERQGFGSELYQLRVDDALVTASDVSGRPTVTYKVRVELDDGTRAKASTAILSRCHDLSHISIAESPIEPDRIRDESYNGTLTLTYRGSDGGEDVRTTVVEKNVTVEVRE